MTASHTAGVTSSQRWTVHTPALATAMSSRPSWSTPSDTAPARRVGDPARRSWAVTTRAPVAATSRAVSSSSAGVAMRVGDVLDVGAAVDGDDVGSFGGQADRVVPALAPSRSGHQGHPAGDPSGPRLDHRIGGGHPATPAVARRAPGVGSPGDVEGLAAAFEHRLEHRARRDAVARPPGTRSRPVERLLGQAVAAVDDGGTGQRTLLAGPDILQDSPARPDPIQPCP